MEEINQFLEKKYQESIKNDNKMYVVTSFPKSASSYLNNLLTTLFECKKAIYCSIRRANNQDLYLPNMIESKLSTSTLARHHFIGTLNNMELLNKFNLDPIVLVRNIYDVVPSWRDDFVKDLPENEDDSTGHMGIGYVTKEFLSFEHEKQMDFIIDMQVPWLIKFYASWYRLIQQNKINGLMISYENLTLNAKDTLKSISKFYKEEFSDEVYDNIIDKVSEMKASNNFNVGIKGRGPKELTPKQIEKIKKLCSYYSDVDFSLIGIN